MNKSIAVGTVILVLSLSSVSSSAAVPLIPVVITAAEWIGGFFLLTPTDELITGAIVGGIGATAGKQAVKQAGKAMLRPKGPIVKTGPTASQVRSRNQDGRWRAKRSDAGQSKKEVHRE